MIGNFKNQESNDKANENVEIENIEMEDQLEEIIELDKIENEELDFTQQQMMFIAEGED